MRFAVRQDKWTAFTRAADICTNVVSATKGSNVCIGLRVLLTKFRLPSTTSPPCMMLLHVQCPSVEFE